MTKLLAMLIVLTVLALFAGMVGLVSWLYCGLFWPGAVAALLVRLVELVISAAIQVGSRG